MRFRRLALVGFIAHLFGVSLLMPALAEASAGTPSVIITEIKLGDPAVATGDNPKEYVAIYNQTDQAISLSGWTLEYAKTTFNQQFCADSNWASHSVSGSASTTVLSGTLLPGQVSQPITRQLTDNTAGSLHLVDAGKIIQDLVGWGSASPCYQGGPAAIPANAKSLERSVDCVTAYPVNNGNNSADFAIANTPSPGYLAGQPINCPSQSPGNTGSGSASSCEGVIISELLPNPAGTDTGHEFIELYNPTNDFISLAGCGLQVGGNSQIYHFGNTQLSPQQFKAFYDNDTGLTLPNSAGGTVYLLSPALAEISSAAYPANLADDQSYVWLGGTTWHATYAPTPGDINEDLPDKPCPVGQERNSDTGRCRLITAIADLQPCPAGESRNPDTNRCRAEVIGGSTLKPCRADQERNPATNRCRLIMGTLSSLVPCKQGQTRNPATNRCRSASLSSKNLKPCAIGQERNPETNRCRKALAGNTAMPNVHDVAGISTAGKVSWWFAGLTLLAAAGYGVWEWRADILVLLARLRHKN